MFSATLRILQAHCKLCCCDQQVNRLFRVFFTKGGSMLRTCPDLGSVIRSQKYVKNSPGQHPVTRVSPDYSFEYRSMVWNIEARPELGQTGRVCTASIFFQPTMKGVSKELCH